MYVCMYLDSLLDCLSAVSLFKGIIKKKNASNLGTKNPEPCLILLLNFTVAYEYVCMLE